jgi:hypothetical protein
MMTEARQHRANKMIASTPDGMNAGDALSRALIPAIKTVSSALPADEQSSLLRGLFAHLFGFVAAKYGVQTALELIDELRPLIKRMSDIEVRH